MAKMLPTDKSNNAVNSPHISTDDARGGSTPHIVRYILGFSLLIAIVAMSAVWIIPALSS
jgi:hypothetical protein